MVDKNFFKKDLFKNLEKGDVFKFTSVGKFFTVFDITDDVVKYNSSLWFEMYDWDNDVIDYFEYKKNKNMIETNSIEKGSKKPVLDETNSVTGGQLMITIIAFLGIICFLCFFGSLAIKTNEKEKQKKQKERIELNGKTYVEE